jgi:hypothetical protein
MRMSPSKIIAAVVLALVVLLIVAEFGPSVFGGEL